MLIFVDTEFTDFIDMQLISLGAVAEDGREFYVEISDYDKQASSAFVKSVVEPLLSGNAVTSAQAGAKLYEWLEGLNTQAQLLIEYLPGDWDLAVELMGNELPKNIIHEPELVTTGLYNRALMQCLTLGCHHERLFALAINKYKSQYLEYFNFSRMQHHSLNDARSMKIAWEAACKEIANFRPNISDLTNLHQ